ncbi:hypothetical protein [Photorhabdus luminescens]|uniref:Uncharacterized protein n=1 Tax=Photorhabdus luminescens subsp. mexicana TaxID=2100167 RepID=A0A4R4IUR1_PHOLU|nr:hypothetical protein [Photorhabdus luminescens]TDB44271.1 hypothetical protein C5468_22375 [Photorhabdus luminescens subsp. mexicana]
MFLVNMTAYLASDEQREMGVIDVEQHISHAIREKLSFASCPSVEEMTLRANELADIAVALCEKYKADGVLVYAKTFFMHILISAISSRGIAPYVTYAPKVTVVGREGNINRTYKHANLVRAVAT